MSVCFCHLNLMVAVEFPLACVVHDSLRAAMIPIDIHGFSIKFDTMILGITHSS